MQFGRFELDLVQPRLMGIVNLTPDSFSDGGLYGGDLTAALRHAEDLVKAGADILDIGGESSRPGAAYVSPEEEWRRVKPVLAAVNSWNIPISLDTRNAAVMAKAVAAGYVDIINDISALADAAAAPVLAAAPAIALVLMHMRGEPKTMQHNPSYVAVTDEVIKFLQARIDYCRRCCIAQSRLIIDPGIGFGKTAAHNLTLMRTLERLGQQLGCPLLLGVSRKSILGTLTGEPDPQARIGSTVVAEIEGVRRGAKIIRTHNVRQSRQALLTYLAISGSED